MEKIRLIYLTLILFCCCQLSAQNKTVTGQVAAAGSEEPIIGASVVVRGTSNGTITDVDGNFSLSVPVGKELQISYIGYITQYVRVPKNNKVAVVLEEDSSFRYTKEREYDQLHRDDQARRAESTVQ